MSATPLRELEALRAEDVVRRQREALARGRAKVNAQRQREARHRQVLVMDLAAADAQAGKPARGRAGRIVRKLRGIVSERTVLRILSAALNSVADSPGLNGQAKERCP